MRTSAGMRRVTGRFVTGDPYQASGETEEPGSWNRYAYDPANFQDRSGLQRSECAYTKQGCTPVDLHDWLPTEGGGSASGSAVTVVFGLVSVPNLSLCYTPPLLEQGQDNWKPEVPSCEELMSGLLTAYLAAQGSPLTMSVDRLISEGVENG
jgi:hypothetical protein